MSKRKNDVERDKSTPIRYLYANDPLVREFQGFHSFYREAAEKQGWPEPRKLDSIHLIFRHGVPAAREEIERRLAGNGN